MKPFKTKRVKWLLEGEKQALEGELRRFDNIQTTEQAQAAADIQAEIYDIDLALKELNLDWEDSDRGTCRYCGKLFDEMDMATRNSHPTDVCVGCFTSNA